MAKQTRGLCKYCGKEYTKGGMLKHLKTCRERNLIFEEAKEKEKCYELSLYGKYNKDYWLIIQIKETATLLDLDEFIRDIWVECCEHLSVFTIFGEIYEAEAEDDFLWDEPTQSMNCKLKDILKEGMKFQYEYDYGSTTELVLEVKDYYDAPKEKDVITILSRNNKKEFVCSQCEKNIAKWINPMGFYDGNFFWCESCQGKLENKDVEIDEEDIPEILLPVCNSPRMGVCAYCGSKIYPEQFHPDKINESK